MHFITASRCKYHVLIDFICFDTFDRLDASDSDND